jgi:hypothetical protein
MVCHSFDKFKSVVGIDLQVFLYTYTLNLLVQNFHGKLIFILLTQNHNAFINTLEHFVK